MPNIENIKKYKNIHMIGIGGVSMSGIAAILSNWGFTEKWVLPQGKVHLPLLNSL